MMMMIIRCNCCGNFIKLINSVTKVIPKVVIHLVLKMPQAEILRLPVSAHSVILILI